MRCETGTGLWVSLETAGEGVSRLTLAGRLTRDDIRPFLMTMAQVEATGPQRLLVDLSAISRVDSCGLGLLCGALFRLRQTGGTLVLVGVSAEADQLLHSTGLMGLFLPAYLPPAGSDSSPFKSRRSPLLK